MVKSLGWIKQAEILKIQYRLVFPLSIFQHILYKDERSKLTLKKQLFILPGISAVIYQKAYQPAILLWMEKYIDTPAGWNTITKTINTYLDVYDETS